MPHTVEFGISKSAIQPRGGKKGTKCDRHSTTTVPSAPALGTKRGERESTKGQTREIIVSLYYDSSSLTLRSVKVLNRAFCIIMPLSIVPVPLSLPLSTLHSSASVHA